MKKLIEDLNRCKGHRNQYWVRPTFSIEVDRDSYYFSFLPTILWCPWIYRHPNSTGVIDIWWLHFHILIGKWEELSCGNCKNQNECVQTKRINWYGDNVFENGEKCSDFEARW